jgi:hypothetical protein
MITLIYDWDHMKYQPIVSTVHNLLEACTKGKDYIQISPARARRMDINKECHLNLTSKLQEEEILYRG